MINEHDDLARLGWSDWFEERSKWDGADSVARVAAVDRGMLLLMDPTGTFRGKLTGGRPRSRREPGDIPCVGDWARVEKRPDDDWALVHAILDRKTVLRRRATGDSAEFQMIAANVDCVIVVQSCHYDFNLKRMERYLVMIREGGAEPRILLTKTDLVEPKILAARLEEIRAAGIVAPTLTLSNVTREGVDDLKKTLEPRRTYCFVGSSGVGKSSLINHLIGNGMLPTKAVSGTGEGRHTTVRRELIILEGGALVVDNPGMREFGIVGAESGLEGGFADIIALTARCRYGNCGHTNEPGCAVLEALESGVLGRGHYANYLKLKEESEFHQMSRVEKRRKDRDFGKFIKSKKKEIGYE
jgi:ribosome biogenesis GTPase